MRPTELTSLHSLPFDKAEEQVVAMAASLRQTHSLGYSECLDQTAKKFGLSCFDELHQYLKNNCIESELA